MDKNITSPAALPSPICFRIRGIPPGWGSKDVVTHFQEIDEELNPSTAELSGPFPSPFSNEQCALLNLDNCTSYLNMKFSDPDAEVDYFVEVGGEMFHMVIDRHFYGLTPMNKPTLPIVVDVIAITGMGGHAFGSWRSRRPTPRPVQRPMWIRDFLPAKFPNARIMTYGYNCSLVRPNETRMMDYRQNFEDALLNARHACRDRQIIFIGHSLGGLLIIQLLIEWSNSLTRNRLRDYVRGIFLFGVPHQGLEVSDLYDLVEEDTDGKKCAGILAQLQEGSEFLEQQQRSLANVSKHFKGLIYSFFETRKTQQVGSKIDQRAVGYVRRVGRLSAQLFLPEERRIQVDSNHTDIVKLSSAEEHVFQTVVTGIRSCLVNPGSILSRLLWDLAQNKDGYDSVGQPERSDDSIDDLKNSKKYFWLSNNADYKIWSTEERGYKLLIIGGHKELRPITLYHERVLGMSKSSCLSLCYLYRFSASNTSAHTVWTLLRQATDVCSKDQKDLIFTEFFRYLIQLMADDLRVKLDGHVTAKEILDASSSPRLWLALRVAIKSVAKYRSMTGVLTIILDLDESPREEYQELANNIRLLGRQMYETFGVVRILIVDPPTTTGLPLTQSEFLILYSTYTAEMEACLKTLAFKNTRYEKVSPHHKHTFDWLWQTEEYRSWNTRERADPGFLLIEGKPGSGKSTLMRYIKENIKPVSEDAIIGSFFYSARDGGAESCHLNMLKALLHSILAVDESFFFYFQLRFRERREASVHVNWRLDDMKKIMGDIFTKHPLPTTIYCVIDAMDESDKKNRIEIIEHFERLLDATQKNEAGALVKIVLGSRPINELEDNLSGGTRRISLQENTKVDIEKYTITRLKDKVFEKCDISLRKELEDHILATADGVFLWVRLVIDELEQKVRNGTRLSRLLTLVKSLPKDLRSFYEHILEELKVGRDKQDLIDGGRILGFCLLSHRAIELGELCDALALLDNEEADEPNPLQWAQGRSIDIRRLVTHCAGGLVDIKDRSNRVAVVQLMHQTVVEFLKSPPESMIRTPFDLTNSDQASLVISLTCVRFLEIVYEELSSGGCQICTKYLEERPLLKYSLEYLMENRNSIHAKAEARLKRLVEGLRDHQGSNAYILLWRLVEIEISHTIKNRLGFLLLDAAKNGHAMAIGNLLVAGADVEFTGPNNGKGANTALHLAAIGGHDSAVVVLLDGAADIGCLNHYSSTPLGVAAGAGKLCTVDLLLSLGAQDRSIFGATMIETAAANGHFDIIQRAWELDGRDALFGSEDDSYYRTSRWERALFHALLGAYDDIYLYIVSRVEYFGLHALFWTNNWDRVDVFGCACIGGDETRVKKLLALAGTRYDKYIELAKLYGNSSIVQLLEIEKQGGVTALSGEICQGSGNPHIYTGNPGKSHIAKLHIAAAYDHGVIINWLAFKGIELDSPDRNGSTALHLAAQNGCINSCHELIFRGANIHARDSSGAAPLHMAAVSDPTPQDLHRIIAYLWEFDADPNAADNNLETPLYHAARGGFLKGCQALLNTFPDCNIEAADKSGSTALHIAAVYGHLDVCMFLVDRGADRSTLDRNGSTPSRLALDAGFDDLANLLSLPSSRSSPTEGSPDLSSEVSEMECGTERRCGILRSASLGGEISSIIQPDDEREATSSPVSRKRRLSRREEPDNLTEGMDSKRARDYDGSI